MGSEEDMPEFDMKSEALLPVLRGEVKAHFHCHRADDIFTAIRIAKEFELDYVLIHCTDGHIIADELAEEEASCVIGPVICDRCKPEMANLTPRRHTFFSRHKGSYLHRPRRSADRISALVSGYCSKKRS